MTKKDTSKQKKRTSLTTLFKRDVKHFHTQTGMEYTVLGIRATKNPRFYERLLNGGTITLASVDKVYDFMAAQGFHYNRILEGINGRATETSGSNDRAGEGINDNGQNV